MNNKVTHLKLLIYNVIAAFLFVSLGSAVYSQNPASSAGNISYPFRNPDLSIEERVSNIVSLMTLDEKIAFLSQVPGMDRLGIKRMGQVEGLHGLAMGQPGGWGRRDPVTTTTFPQSIGMGETWDPEIVRQAGAIEGYEARYVYQSPKYNGRGGLININSQVARPAEELKGFQRVSLKAGERKTVTIPLMAQRLAYWDISKNDWQVERDSIEIRLGASSMDIRLRNTLLVK
jgi:hypothetical protein